MLIVVSVTAPGTHSAYITRLHLQFSLHLCKTWNLQLSQFQFLPKMNTNPISLSIRTAMSLGRLNPAAPSLAGALRPLHQTTPRMASKHLTRLSSTTARPTAATLNLDSRPHAKAVSPSPVVLRANSTSAPANNEVKLDWDSFFKLRASRRRYSLVSSVASSAISTTVGVQVLSGQDLEHLGATVMGLDPFVVLGLATAACGAVGWLLGPALGNGIWGLVYRKYKPSVNTVSSCQNKAAIYAWSVLMLFCFRCAEREGVLRSNSPVPCRSLNQLDL